MQTRNQIMGQFDYDVDYNDYEYLQAVYTTADQEI